MGPDYGLGLGLLTKERVMNDLFEEGIIYDKDILEELFDKDFNKAKQGMEELVGTSPLPMLVKGVIIEMAYKLRWFILFVFFLGLITSTLIRK